MFRFAFFLAYIAVYRRMLDMGGVRIGQVRGLSAGGYIVGRRRR